MPPKKEDTINRSSISLKECGVRPSHNTSFDACFLQACSTVSTGEGGGGQGRAGQGRGGQGRAGGSKHRWRLSSRDSHEQDRHPPSAHGRLPMAEYPDGAGHGSWPDSGGMRDPVALKYQVQDLSHRKLKFRPQLAKCWARHSGWGFPSLPGPRHRVSQTRGIVSTATECGPAPVAQLPRIW